MTILLSKDQVRAIEDHARTTFPEECCGLLLGMAGKRKRVLEVRPARNVAESNRGRRYMIDPTEILAAERDASRDGREILGFYHSHPNHPAAPSDFDLSHAAWPGYSYVILSIVDRNPKDIASWLLDSESGTKKAEALSITP